MKKSFVVLLVAISVAFWFGTVFAPKAVPVQRARQIGYAELNQARMESGFANMKEQFTPGYKAQNLEPDVIHSCAPTARQLRGAVDFSQGKVFETQTATNLAVVGRGWFVVRGAKEREFTRDGRFQFFTGTLRNHWEQEILAYPLDTYGNIAGEPESLAFSLDPSSKLYLSRYTSFRFDEQGRFYGIATLTDPTTGQKIITTTPLFQVVLAHFEDPGLLERTHSTCFVQGRAASPTLGVAGSGVFGTIAPSSLELSNVDYMHEGAKIGMAKVARQENDSGTLVLYGMLSEATLDCLGENGVVCQVEDELLILQAKDSMQLLKALSRARAKAPASEREYLVQAIQKAAPNMVLQGL